IIVHTEANTYAFPGNVHGSPSDWDFHSAQQFSVTVVPKNLPIYLFNVATDSDYLVMGWQEENRLMPTATPDEAEYQFHIKNLVNTETLMKNGDSIYDYSFRYYFGDKILGEKQAFSDTKELILKARSLSGKPEKLQVALLLKNGSAYGKTIFISPETEEYKISLTELEPVKTVTLPRPYPGFLPYYFEHHDTGGFKLENVESLQFSIGPDMDLKERRGEHALGIISVRLE
ncbi:MAG: hypothetical protein WA951_06385, partial [Leeuwenhoekiella sp.]